jgi:uncharacterized RDD family membrane protein YckC
MSARETNPMVENERLKKWQEKIESSKYQSNPQERFNPTDRQEKVIIINNYASEPKEKRNVGFWRRIFATIIDSIVLSIVYYLLRTQGSLYTIIIGSLYYILLPITSLQGTIGKATIGAKITDIHGNRLGLDRSLGRYLASLLSAALFCIGFLMIAFHGRKRGLHDLIAGTEVVNKE